MSDKCNNSCSTCSKKDCSSKQQNQSLILPTNNKSKIKKLIGITSGKGGVGKSLISSILAVMVNRKGLKTAIIDADVTGPSIPKAFGVKSKVMGNANSFFPCYTDNNIAIMSLNLMLQNENDPVIWRSPMINSTIKQFWTNTNWGDIDIMFIDMPPGTGDVQLTVFQSLPLDGLVIVLTPQELVKMMVEKAMKMSSIMNVPILGIVENMSYVKCPCCNECFSPFGEANIESIAKQYNISNIAKMPLDNYITKLVDSGNIDDIDCDYLNGIIDQIIKL